MKHSKRNFWTLILLAASVLCLIFAACGGKGVKLTFDTDGGPAVEAQTVEPGTEVELPVPERDGYSFEGWYLSSDLSGDPVTKFVAESDTTFYAKWARVYTVTLDVGEGQLATKTVTLKAGESILNGVKDYVPTRAGWLFGEWLLDNTALSSASMMPEHDVTLTARYKVGYTVKVWLQKLDQSGYEAGEDITGYDYPIANYTPKTEIKGFTAITHEGEVKTKDLTETPANNVYTVYFDRNNYTVTLRSNFPEGAEERRSTISFLYGNEVELPYDAFSAQGYLLVGWATGTSGDPEYASQAIKGKIQNGDGKEYKDVFVFDDNITLYAVWQKGHYDLFGGSDVIYVFDADGYVILSRGGYYYQGDYNERNETFSFENDAELHGGLYGEGFYYSDLDRVGDYTLYRVGEGLYTDQKISLKEDNQITYTDGQGVSEGTCYLGDDGFYHATFTSGPMADETMTMFLGEAVTADGARLPAYMIRREEEVEYGRMQRLGITPDGHVGSYGENYLLTLDGFQQATISVGASTSTYLYSTDAENEEYFTLYNTSDVSVYGTFKFMVTAGRMGYILYAGALHHTYTGENGATLYLDGACNATYQVGSTSWSGTYTAMNSRLGGYVITAFTSNGTRHVFLVTNGGTEEEPLYTLEEKPEGYAEYYYTSQAYYSPLLVVNDAAEDKGSIYSRSTASSEYIKVAEGDIVPIEGTDRYVFTVTQNLTPEESVVVTPINVLRLKAFTFSLGVNSNNYNVSYWYSVTYDGEDATDLEVVYTGKDGDTLTIVGGFAIYKPAEGEALTGVYSTLNGYEKTTIQVVYRVGNSSEVYYFELDTENGATFLILDQLLGSARGRTPAGTANTNETLRFDGKGGATYTIAVQDGDDTVIQGTYKENTEADIFGTRAYHFSSEEGEEFDFILLVASTTVYFTRFNEEMPTELTSDDGVTLTLDGFSYKARLTEGSTTVDGSYIISDNAITFTVNGTRRYFDVTGTTFTQRGREAGTYLYFENQYNSGLAFEFDGYGAVRVLMLDMTDANAEPEELGTGTYRSGEESGTWVVEYEDAHGSQKYTGRLAQIPISTSQAVNVFLVEHKEVVRTYVDASDWSILTIDSAGDALFRTSNGTVEIGLCVIISDNLLYYVNASGTNAHVYYYDYAEGSIQKATSGEYYYYSSDLRALRFSRYGFVTRDGETQYFYITDAEGRITAYRQAPGTEGENEYGFVTEDFGVFGADTITVGGITYYNNEGYAISFARDAQTAAEYPVLYHDSDDNESKKLVKELSFQPTGAVAFRVAGRITLDGVDNPLACTVVREVKLDENGEPILDEDGNQIIDAFYVLVGNFRFDIAVDYQGKDGNSYTISSMKYVQTVYNASFYQTYLLLYMFFGSRYANLLTNVYGNFTLTREYNTEGDPIEGGEYLDVDLGISDVTLLDGTVVEKLEHCSYEIVNGRYVVTYQGEDKNTYKFYFELGANSMFGVYVYSLEACVRVQSFDWQDGEDNYHLDLERVVATDTASVGGIYDFTLKKNDVKLEFESVYVDRNNANVLYCVSRTRTHLPDDEEGVNTGKITASAYYIITLIEDKEAEEGGGSADDETTGAVPLYKSFTVTERKNIKTVYDRTGNSYADIDESDQTVVGFFFVSGMYFPKTTEYDAETKTYTATLSDVLKFSIKIEEEDGEEVAVFSLVIGDPSTEQDDN